MTIWRAPVSLSFSQLVPDNLASMPRMSTEQDLGGDAGMDYLQRGCTTAAGRTANSLADCASAETAITVNCDVGVVVSIVPSQTQRNPMFRSRN